MVTAKINATFLAAVIAAIAAIISAIVAALSNRSVAKLQEDYKREKESAEFIKEQLSKLYYPVSLHLRAANHLYKRYFESTTTEEEKTEIEHAWKEHNSSILSLLVEGAMYLEPDAPEAVTTELLEHLVQWETVYKLKYVSQTYKGPVFAGIKCFGYCGFPRGKKIYYNEVTKAEGLDGYFKDKTKELTGKLLKKIQAKIDSSSH